MYEAIKEQFKDIKDLAERKRLIKNAITAEWKRNNRDKVNLSQRKYRKRHPDKIKEQNLKFAKANPTYKKEYYQNNKEQAKEWWKNRSTKQKVAKLKTNAKWKYKQYHTNVSYKLRCIISTAIHRSLKKTIKTDSIKKLLGYTTEELKKHLESQFEDWMNWDNLGLTATKEKETWQIDHIIPVNTFDIKKCGDKEFKKCWALSNLRPLDSFINNTRPFDGSDIYK